jgi:hypothetical protein
MCIKGQGSMTISKIFFSKQIENEPLHVFIEAKTETLIDQCIKKLVYIVEPKADKDNILKKNQLKMLAYLNGIISADSAFSRNLLSATNKPPWFDPTLFEKIDDSHQIVYNIISEENNKGKRLLIDKYPQFFSVDSANFEVASMVPERKPSGVFE